MPKVAESTGAINYDAEYYAKSQMPYDKWHLRVDQNLQFYTKEYIVEENITPYSYQIKKDVNGKPCQIYSFGHETDGDIINSYKRGNGDRARAEVVGFEKIEKEIFEGRINNRFFVWISPPGRPEDGFSKHNFTFIGHVLEDRVNMVAYRNWMSQKANSAFLNRYLLEKEKVTEEASAIEMLKNPVFIPQDEGCKIYHDVINLLDRQREDINENNCRWLLDKLKNNREAIINSINVGDFNTASKLQNAHDNYALALLQGRDHGITSIEHWAMKPPVLLRGSCGFGGSVQYGKANEITYLGAEAADFDCPRCKGKIESGKGITVCPHCGARKEDYGNCA